jgi:hypothetical protein
MALETVDHNALAISLNQRAWALLKGEGCTRAEER